jgi:hypothetical protein
LCDETVLNVFVLIFRGFAAGKNFTKFYQGFTFAKVKSKAVLRN